MSLEGKIREAFKKKEKTKRDSRWDPDTQPNIYNLSTFLRKSGYRLVDILVNQESTVHEILIEPIKSDHLHPEISHDAEENKFYVNVLKYGMLEASDLEEVVKGYENALSIIEYLEGISLRDLEIEDSGEE